MDNIHHYTFQGVDMAGIRTTRDNGYVWVLKGGSQVRMKREQAITEGYEIVEVKHAVEKRKIKAVISDNIRELIRAGKKKEQAVAIALNKAGRNKRKRRK